MPRCGLDMIEIQRVEDGIARFGEKFLQRFFTDGERLDCQDHPHRLAARIAAKEAVAKEIKWIIAVRSSSRFSHILFAAAIPCKLLYYFILTSAASTWLYQ